MKTNNYHPNAEFTSWRGEENAKEVSLVKVNDKFPADYEDLI
jgi:hypothetical protein